MDKNILLETNNTIFEIDKKMVQYQKNILNNDVKLNEISKEIETVTETIKVEVWSNSSYKNNDQRTAVLNKILNDDELFVELKEQEETIILDTKKMKIELELLKAEKNYHKRNFDVFMLFNKENK